MYQGTWSIIERDFESDIIPMCRSEGVFISFQCSLPNCLPFAVFCILFLRYGTCSMERSKYWSFAH
jgi:hypothetical protein